MNLVDLCPVGALTSKDFRFTQRVWFLGSTPSVCHGCDTGCNIFIDHNKPKNQEERVYRFRPRRNDTVNGHFICDTGRMSYKELNENRQRECVYQGGIITPEEALEQFHFMLDSQKRVMILADANLYTEDLRAIKSYAKEIGALLFVPLSGYYDEKFADEFLRSSLRTANAKGVENLHINRKLSGAYDIDLLINFNHPSPHLVTASQTIAFGVHQSTDADLIFPLASFAEYSGTVTNKNNITQECQKAIRSTGETRSAKEWVAVLPRRV